jgi:arginyl-tRNA synthetase
LLDRYAEVVEEAAEHYSPNLLTTYLFDLAHTYNLFYQKHRIIEADGEQKNLRLALTKATGNILHSGLHLLGMRAPEKM